MTAAITLHQPRRLIVGAGTIGEVGALVSDAVSALVIATPITAGFIDRLRLPGKVEVFDAISGEPDVETLEWQSQLRGRRSHRSSSGSAAALCWTLPNSSRHFGTAGRR